MSFEDYFNVINFAKEEYTSQKIIYKFFKSYENDYYSYSDILSYNKEYVFNLQNLFENSYKSITLYVIQNGVNYHKIFFVSKDSQNSTIRKEKFEEDLKIDPPFDVFIRIERINAPIYLSPNTADKILKPTFRLKKEYRQLTYDETEKKVLYFYTKTIEKSPHTKKEIYKLCIPYLFNLQTLYKKEKVIDHHATSSNYEIIIKTLTNEETIYYCEIDNEGEYTHEDRIYNNLEPTIHYNYKIKITITLIYDPTYFDDILNIEELEHLRFRLQNLTKELETYQNKSKETNKCVKSETCCICLTNPSNIIFTDCGHLCICGSCNEKLTELKCPMCRTEITQPRLTL